jgi:hypothetical protein
LFLVPIMFIAAALAGTQGLFILDLLACHVAHLVRSLV